MEEQNVQLYTKKYTSTICLILEYDFHGGSFSQCFYVDNTPSYNIVKEFKQIVENIINAKNTDWFVICSNEYSTLNDKTVTKCRFQLHSDYALFSVVETDSNLIEIRNCTFKMYSLDHFHQLHNCLNDIILFWTSRLL